MKLKAVLAVTAALSFGGAFAQANFSDVPAGHWAKDAVEKMAAQGCIIGFPDGTFRGNEGLTRYQAALILARCLQNTTVVGGLDNETVESLKNAVQELSSELAALGVRIADVEDNAATKDDVAVLEERIAALEEAAGDKGEPVEGGDEGAGAEVQAAIDELVAADEAAAAQIEDLTGALDELVNQLEQLATAQDELTSRVEALEAGAGEGEDNGDVAAALEDLAAGQDDLNGRVDELAATLDDVAVSIDDLNARVDELAAAGEENAAVLEEINARIEELAGAIDDVNVRVDELEGTVGDVAATVEGQTEQIESNAASIVALQDLTVLLNEDIVGLEDRISALESDKANAEDVDARFTNLNRDLTDLTNRVTVVETNLSDLQGKFNDLNGTYGFTTSGEVGFSYFVARTWGDIDQDFDIDRLMDTKFSSGADGADSTKDSKFDYADFAGGKRIVGTDGRTDLGNGDVEGRASTSLTFNINFNSRGTNGTSADSSFLAPAVNAGLAVKNVVAEFGLKNGELKASNADEVTSNLQFRIKGLTTNFTVDGAPVKLELGTPSTKFSTYSYNDNGSSRGPGFKATVDGSTLPGIGAWKPQITAIYGSVRGNTNTGDLYTALDDRKFVIFDETTNTYVQVYDQDGNPVTLKANTAAVVLIPSGVNTLKTIDGRIVWSGGANFTANFDTAAFVDTSDDNKVLVANQAITAVKQGTKDNVNNANEYNVYYRGIRASIDPVAGLTLGLNYAEAAGDVNATANYSTQTFSADLKGSNVALGGLTLSKLESEFAQNTVGGTARNAFYARAETTFGNFGVQAQGHSIAKDYFGGLTNDSGAPFKADRVGFGAGLNGNLGPVAFNAFGGTDALQDNSVSVTAFGANVSTTISIFSAGGYVRSTSASASTGVGDFKASAVAFGANIGATLGPVTFKGFVDQVSDVSGTIDSAKVFAKDYNLTLDDEKVTQIGVSVESKGTIVTGLDLDASYTLAEADRSKNTIAVNAKYATNISGFDVSTYGNYQSVSDTDAGADDTVMYKFGVKGSSPVLATILAPQVYGSFDYYSRSHTEAAAYTASENKWLLGVKFHQFLLDKTTAAVQYANWSGTNRQYNPFNAITNGAGGFADANNGGAGSNLNGVYGELNFYDVNFAYGQFKLTDTANQVTNGQAFKISYKVKF